MFWTLFLLAFMPQYHRPATLADSVYDTLPTNTKGLYFCDADIASFMKNKYFFVACETYRFRNRVVYAFEPSDLRISPAAGIYQVAWKAAKIVVVKNYPDEYAKQFPEIRLDSATLNYANVVMTDLYTVPYWASLIGIPGSAGWEWNMDMLDSRTETIKECARHYKIPYEMP